MRNWLIGYYIVEFEQHGKDRAEYGTQLLKKLEERVDRKGLTRNTFQSSRNFYRMYPQMIENFKNRICTTVSCKSTEDIISLPSEDTSMRTDIICTTASCKFVTSGETLVSKLSFSHINEIMKVDDPLARYFYEQECIKCTCCFRPRISGALLPAPLDASVPASCLHLQLEYCLEALHTQLRSWKKFWSPSCCFSRQFRWPPS